MNILFAFIQWLIATFSNFQRTALNDFDRFKLRFAKKQRNKLLTIAYNTLKKRTKADGTVRVIKKDRKLRIQELKKAKKTTGGKKK